MIRLQTPKPDRKYQLAFFKTRAKLAHAVPRWARSQGLGAEWRLLQQIIAGSCYQQPFGWKVLKGQAHSAEKLGFSYRTFERHLSRLRAKGLVVGHYVVQGKDEVPCFTVSDEVLHALSASAKVAVSELENWRMRGTGISSENPVVPGGMAITAESVEYNPLLESTPSESSHTTPSTEVKRRLYRRRCRRHRGRITMKLTNLGSGTEDLSSRPKSKTPSVRLAEHFESEWDRTRRAVPAEVMMHLPLKPWPIGGKTRFYKWANETLLPALDQDIEQAEALISRYCDDVAQRRISRPAQDRAVFVNFTSQIEKYLKTRSHTRSQQSDFNTKWRR